jgi:hypothetical protein
MPSCKNELCHASRLETSATLSEVTWMKLTTPLGEGRGADEVPLVELPVLALPLVGLPLAELPLAELPFAEPPLAELPLAEPPLAELPLAELPFAGRAGVELGFPDIELRWPVCLPQAANPMSSSQRLGRIATPLGPAYAGGRPTCARSSFNRLRKHTRLDDCRAEGMARACRRRTFGTRKGDCHETHHAVGSHARMHGAAVAVGRGVGPEGYGPRGLAGTASAK